MSFQEMVLVLVDAMTFISVVFLSAGAMFLLVTAIAHFLRS
jgi:hypothetical protein